MNRWFARFGVPLVAACALLAGCDSNKSANPLSPTVAGPIPGVAITAPKPLDLGAYRLFAPQPKASALAAARFDTTVEVLARAPRDPNEAMADWWRHWDFETSVYGHGINIQAPMAGGYNILPLIEWIRKKAKEHQENARPPIDLEPAQ